MRRVARNRWWAAALCPVVLMSGGCFKNAAYIYETEKVSISLEARPDPSQPVSGSVGIKQRIVAVVPAQNEPEAKQGPGTDAVSVLSSFDFEKGKSPGFFAASPIDIRSVMITGKAARSIPAANLPKAFEAIAITPIDPLSKTVRSALERATATRNGDARVRVLLSKGYDNLTAQEKTELEALTGLTGQLDPPVGDTSGAKRIYAEMRKQLGLD